MKKTWFVILIVFVVLGLGIAGYTMIGRGKVKISTDQADSQILIDGNEVGSGKIETQLKAGKHKVEIKLEEYANISQSFKVYGGLTKNFNFKLTYLPEFSSLATDAITMSFNKDRGSLFFAGDGGLDIYKRDMNTEEDTKITQSQFGSLEKVKWSPNNEYAFIWDSGEAGMLDLKRGDLVNQEFFSWGEGIIDASWSPGGQKIAYIYQPDAEQFSLYVSDLKHEAPKIVYDLKLTEISEPFVEWTADGENFLIKDQDLYVFNIYEEKLTKITEEQDIELAHLTKSGKYVVYTNENDTYVLSLDKKYKEKIGSSFENFCFSENGQYLIGFKEGEFYRIALQSGKNTKLAYNGDRIEVPDEMMLSSDGKTLYTLLDNEISSLKIQTETIDKK